VTVDAEHCITCGDTAVAARVVSVEEREAVVAVGDATERVALDLVPDAQPGDHVLCHAGIALELLEEERA
jgi:hydrogenase expression/formation protein HypC